MDLRFQIHRGGQGSYSTSKDLYPSYIGNYSLDSARKFYNDDRNLNFLKLKDEGRVSLNLNVSPETIKKRKFGNMKKEEKLDIILDWCLANKYEIQKKNSKGQKCLSVDVICLRGLLTELLTVPYELNEGLVIHATRFNGTIYLLEIEDLLKEQNMTPRELEMSLWGYKFEHHMTGTLGEDPNAYSEYHCVVKSRIGSHSLIYRGEMDAAENRLYNREDPSLDAFVELKTSKALFSLRNPSNFYKFKMRKYWAQSYLVGVPRVICGFRNDLGIVEELKSYKVKEMPTLCKTYWNKNVMVNFLDDFLTWLKSVVVEDDPNLVYEIRRSPSVGLISCRSLGSKSKHTFLSESYVNEIFNE